MLNVLGFESATISMPGLPHQFASDIKLWWELLFLLQRPLSSSLPQSIFSPPMWRLNSPNHLHLWKSCHRAPWQSSTMRWWEGQLSWSCPASKRSWRFPGAFLQEFISSGLAPRWSRTSTSRTSTTSASTTLTIRCEDLKVLSSLSFLVGDSLAGEECFKKQSVQKSWAQGCERFD